MVWRAARFASTHELTHCDEATLSCDEQAYGYERATRLIAPPERKRMHFLKTLFWVLVAVVVVLFASRNWADVTLNLWDDIQADIKIPALLLIVFLLGFLPTWLLLRARLWSCRRRLEAIERTRASTLATPVSEESGEPVI
jgi:uncharacterized integral membrane protein